MLRRTLMLATALMLLTGAATARPTLTAYASEAELQQALSRWREQAQRLQGERRRAMGESLALQAAPAAPLAKAEGSSSDSARVSESITNVQTAGVDEGGIVKRAGDHLVILRRGRLFPVRHLHQRTAHI